MSSFQARTTFRKIAAMLKFFGYIISLFCKKDPSYTLVFNFNISVECQIAKKSLILNILRTLKTLKDLLYFLPVEASHASCFCSAVLYHSIRIHHILLVPRMHMKSVWQMLWHAAQFLRIHMSKNWIRNR